MTEFEEFSRILLREFSRYRELGSEEVRALYGHYELLVRWNRVVNLTSIKKLEDAVVRHYCESLFLAGRLAGRAISVVDIGSGAGFPGIPLAIARPDCRVTLVERDQRKAVFLKEATRDRANVGVVARGAEDIGEKFDWLVSRAVNWKELRPVALRCARCVALLVSAADAAGIAENAGLGWEPFERMPWGAERGILMGAVRST